MKNVIKVFTLLTLVFMSTGVNAQNMKVTGTVYDTTGTQPLYQAMIMAVRVKDSLLLGFTRTNKNGEFSLTGFPVDTFTMVISHPRFDDKNIYIFGSPDNVDINIPTVKMPSKAKELEEIMIYANNNPIYSFIYFIFSDYIFFITSC